MSELLVRKLSSLIALSDEERRALLGLPTQIRTVAARSDVGGLIDTSDNGGWVHLIESGFACRYKYLADGRRQILCFLLPGDLLDLRRFIVGSSQIAVASISALSLRVIPGDRLLNTLERYPRIARVLWLATLTEESICQEWLVSMGQRSAIEAMAHLLCELQTRLEAVGLADNTGFDLPLTQSELADTLGLSTVHVNRTLQELRRQGLVTIQNGKAAIADREALKSLALFSPAYLNLRPNDKVSA